MSGVRLDWRDIAPPPEIHSCDCDHCEMTGDYEAVRWPTLIRLAVAGVEYISDRFMAIRADLAPVPEDYEGAVIQGPKVAEATGVFALPATGEAPTGQPIRWSTATALRDCGWRLRVVDRPGDDDAHHGRGMAVVTSDGEHVGWAMASPVVVHDEYSDSCTWDYTDPTDTGVTP